MNPSDSSAKPDSNKHRGLGFKLVLFGGLSTIITLDLLEHRWVSAAFWVCFLILQLLIPKHFRGERLVKWTLVAAIFLLLIIQILQHLSR